MFMSRILYAIIGGLLILFTVAFYLNNQYKKSTKEKIKLLFNFHHEQSKVVEEKNVSKLPEVIQKWIDHLGILDNNQKIKGVIFKQKGYMRLKPNQNWMKVKAKQYVNIKKPGFLWRVKLKILPFIWVNGRDYLLNKQAEILIKLFGVIPLVNEKKNSKTNQSAMARFLMEVILYPTAVLEDYISWKKIDDTRAKAILASKTSTVEADFIFNDQGLLKRVESMRFKENDALAEKKLCSAEIKSYQKIKGMMIPKEVNISWHLENGIFTWYKLEIEGFKTIS